MLASFRRRSRGSRVRWKTLSASDSNLARVRVVLKSTPSISESTSIVVVVEDDKFFLAFSAAIFRRLRARAFSRTFFLYFLLISSHR